MRRLRPVTGLMAVAVLIGTALLFPTAAPARADAPASGSGRVAGMAVPDVTAPYAISDLPRMKADGVNTVSLFVWWLAPKRAGSTLAPYSGTAPDAALVAEIGAARKLGLSVTLTPLFYCADCEGGWRGTMQPADMNAFFSSYSSFIGHYAQLAAQQGVDTLYVGSEMTSLEDQTARWDDVIRQVRSAFHGTVAYEENWDVIGRAQFLSDVDLIGISSYFPLDDAPAPTLAALRADWTSSHASSTYGSDWVSELEHLATTTHKQIVFGESGYMSGDYAAKQPFLNFMGQADWQLQSDLYQAMLETFSGRPWWAGAVWWEWGKSDALLADSGRSPEGKTAEILLKRWYAQGLRPSNPDVPLATASGVSAASAGSVATVGTSGPTAAAAAGANSGSASGAGLDAAQRAGLFGLLGLLGVMALLCWITLGRQPAARPATARATPRPRRPGRRR